MIRKTLGCLLILALMAAFFVAEGVSSGWWVAVATWVLSGILFGVIMLACWLIFD